MSKFQNTTKLLLAVIAVAVTVLSVAIPFATVQADEVGTFTTYTTNTYALPLLGKSSTDDSLQIYQNNLKFYMSQGATYISIIFYGGYDDDGNITEVKVSIPIILSQMDKYVSVETLPSAHQTYWLTAFNTNEHGYSVSTPITYYYTASFYKMMADNVPFTLDSLSLYNAGKNLDDPLTFRCKRSTVPASDFTGTTTITIIPRILTENADSYSDPYIEFNFPTACTGEYENIYLPSGDYATGYENGRRSGYEGGYSAGLEFAFNNIDKSSASYIAGKNFGYSQGLNDAGDYTFFSLISSVVDVPIKALTGLLDFNLFGIDMSALYLSLFTLCIVIMVVKLLL